MEVLKSPPTNVSSITEPQTSSSGIADFEAEHHQDELQMLSVPVVEGEIELTFALPVDALPEYADREIYVLNSYVNCHSQAEVIMDFVRERASEAGDLSLLQKIDSFGSPRLRMVFDPESEQKSFYIQAKFDIPNMPCSASEELGLPISESEYVSFLEIDPIDSDDALTSAYFKRSIYLGELDNGTEIKAEVDTLLGYGEFQAEEGEAYLLEPANAPLAKIDIEVPHEAGEPFGKIETCVSLLRAGFHNLSFLDCATELTAGTEESEFLRRALRKKQLARTGFGASETRDAIRIIQSENDSKREEIATLREHAVMA